MNQTEVPKIVALQSPLDRKQISTWREVEKRVFENDPTYIPTVSTMRKGEEKEFFIAFHNNTPIGRAAACINRKWIQEKGENLGFIDDFVIDPKYSEISDPLIEHCLKSLRAYGIQGAIVRSHGFPALAAQVSDEKVPPFCLPCNPPSYIDLFEEKGFIKHNEWANFRFKLPSDICKDSVVRGQQNVKRRHSRVGLINIRSKKQINQYNNIKQEILSNHFGYTRQISTNYITSFREHITFALICWLAKFKIYVLESDSGQIEGVISFCPNYNVATHAAFKNTDRTNILAIPKFLLSLRKTKRAEIEVIGLTPNMHGKGLVTLMDYGLKVMTDSGYTEIDTGPIQTENKVILKMIEHLQEKYKFTTQHMKYYTLLYRF